MKKSLYVIIGLFTFLWSACSRDADEQKIDSVAGPIDFNISMWNAAGIGMAPDEKTQWLRIYVNSRSLDEWNLDKEDLRIYGMYDEETYTLYFEEGRYKIPSNLLAQWYKFAFVCLPRLGSSITTMLPSQSNNFNDHTINYQPVLDLQTGQDDLLERGNIYRKIMNRWLKNGENSTENVVMTRVNGQLLIDMGVPEEQFENKVISIKIRLKGTPTRIYIRDQDNDATLVASVMDKEYISVPEWNANKHHFIRLNLLPSELQGDIVVTTQNQAGMTEDYLFPFKGIYGGETIHIKQNTRTKLEFNGLHRDYFTVKYAGYTGSGIGVADDEWNGWKE